MSPEVAQSGHVPACHLGPFLGEQRKCPRHPTPRARHASRCPLRWKSRYAPRAANSGSWPISEIDPGTTQSCAGCLRAQMSGRRFHLFCRALISLNLDSARSNLSLKSHIASSISRIVADVLVLSARPNVKMLLLCKYPMILGSEISNSAKRPDSRAALVGLGTIWMSSKSFI